VFREAGLAANHRTLGADLCLIDEYF
jgi:hypothetical protein